MTQEQIEQSKQIAEIGVLDAGFKVGSSVHWPEIGLTQAFSVEVFPNTYGHPICIAEVRHGVLTVSTRG